MFNISLGKYSSLGLEELGDEPPNMDLRLLLDLRGEPLDLRLLLLDLGDLRVLDLDLTFDLDSAIIIYYIGKINCQDLSKLRFLKSESSTTKLDGNAGNCVRSLKLQSSTLNVDGKAGKRCNRFIAQFNSNSFGGNVGNCSKLAPLQYKVFSVDGKEGNVVSRFPKQCSVTRDVDDNFGNLVSLLR